jgi:hypothetical protein
VKDILAIGYVGAALTPAEKEVPNFLAWRHPLEKNHRHGGKIGVQINWPPDLLQAARRRPPTLSTADRR